MNRTRARIKEQPQSTEWRAHSGDGGNQGYPAPFVEISGEPWIFHRTWNWDLSLSYLDLNGARATPADIRATFQVRFIEWCDGEED